jgi:hypothetical protein
MARLPAVDDDRRVEEPALRSSLVGHAVTGPGLAASQVRSEAPVFDAWGGAEQGHGCRARHDEGFAFIGLQRTAKQAAAMAAM